MLEVHVTFPNAAEAEALAGAAVEQRLAACANILPPVHSIYRWEGKVHAEDEVAVVFKTAEAAVDALVAFLAERHSYEVPAIVIHGPLRATASYETWVAQETRA
jgi:periplasmic divalent cation tolerance protein